MKKRSEESKEEAWKETKKRKRKKKERKRKKNKTQWWDNRILSRAASGPEWRTEKYGTLCSVPIEAVKHQDHQQNQLLRIPSLSRS